MTEETYNLVMEKSKTFEEEENRQNLFKMIEQEKSSEMDLMKAVKAGCSRGDSAWLSSSTSMTWRPS